MNFEFVNREEVFESISRDNDISDNDFSEEVESDDEEQVELLGDSDFIDSGDEKSRKSNRESNYDDNNNNNYNHKNNDADSPCERCECSLPFTFKGWCSPCQAKIYEGSHEFWEFQKFPSLLKEKLFELHRKAHCPYCTLNCLDYKRDLRNVLIYDNNVRAELSHSFSKIGFNQIPGIDPKRVVLKELKDSLHEVSNFIIDFF